MISNVQHLLAFPFEGRGGNPAGVVLEASGLTEPSMQRIAKEVGYSETVFLTERDGNRIHARYFSPEMEVDFCGHATIAAGVALGTAHGASVYTFETNTGDVEVNVSALDGGFNAELTSHQGWIQEIDKNLLSQLLEIFGFEASALSKTYFPRIANAGNSHPVIVLDSTDSLNLLDYDFEALKKLCRAQTWPTVQLIARKSESVWHSRNPFAFGGVYEDPATGSAAAAFGVYLRETANISAGESFTIEQGFEMGQPCLLKVTVGLRDCKVSGTAVAVIN